MEGNLRSILEFLNSLVPCIRQFHLHLSFHYSPLFSPVTPLSLPPKPTPPLTTAIYKLKKFHDNQTEIHYLYPDILNLQRVILWIFTTSNYLQTTRLRVELRRKWCIRKILVLNFMYILSDLSLVVIFSTVDLLVLL